MLQPGLSGPLIYDDHKNLVPLLQEKADYEAAIFENKAGPFGRSFTMATFALNHYLEDRLLIFDLKLTNLFIHLLNGLLLFFFANSLLKIKFSERKSTLLSLFLMSFWVLNPVNTAVVFYSIQRATLLATTFMLMSCICYIKMRLECEKSVGQLWLYLIILLATWFLAMISKENAVLLPLVILSIEICFFNTLNFSKIDKKMVFILSTSLLILTILLFLLMSYLGFLDYGGREFTLLERMSSQPLALLIYIKTILLPQVVDVRIFRDDFTISETLINPITLFSTIFISVLLLLTTLNVRFTQYKYLSIGMLIFFSGHLLESTIFPLELFFLHRNYFPSIGLYLSLVLIVDRIIIKTNFKKLIYVFSVMYCMLLSQHSYAQAEIWSSYESILINSYENNPKSVRVGLQIVGELVKKKDLSASLSINKDLIETNIDNSFPAKIQRFFIYCELAQTIPEHEYKVLDKDLHFNHPEMISLSMDNFLISYLNQQCKHINIRKIIDRLTAWSDRVLSDGVYSAVDLWSIEYYLIEFLFSLGERASAIERLNLHIQLGNQKALYFKEAVLGG